MILKTLGLLAGYCRLFMSAATASETVCYDFNNFSEGLVNGQNGWKTFRKTPDSAAVSVYGELGPTVFIGNAYLSENARWQIRLEAGRWEEACQTDRM